MLPQSVAACYLLPSDAGWPKDGAKNGAGSRREAWIREVDSMLQVLGDRYANKHLVFGIVELLVCRLVPEMGEGGVVELMAERLGVEWEGF